MYKAKFRTGYGQREIPMDVAVIGSTDLEVGQLVTFTPANGDVPDYIAAAAGATAGAALSAATHIIAQSDNTLEYGHIPVENMNYAYSPKVKTTASSATANAPTKKVALFQVTEDDVIAYQE